MYVMGGISENKQPPLHELRQQFEADPDNVELGVALARAVHATGQGDEAERLLRRVLRLHLNHTEAICLLTDILLDKGQYRDATLIWNRLLDVDPHDALSREKLGDIYRSQHRCVEAVNAYLTAAQEYKSRDLESAIRLYQRVLKLDSGNPKAACELMNLGRPALPED